jgi:4-diphosphocytidyl-2-C-methyl-D-erythritol kinase
LRAGNFGSIKKIQAPAKLNIRLKVTGRRPDGYHDLVSIMVPVSLFDHIELDLISSGISLSCHGISVPDDEKNLVFRAAYTFFARLGLKLGASIKLTKNIPVAAGLGGGSSDAAATLKALNETCPDRLSPEVLKNLAVTLGADVPFFLQRGPCIARGIGEILEPIENWPKLWYVIVSPPIEVSTAWVYKNLKLELTTEDSDYIINSLQQGCFEVGHILENDLEAVTCSHFPVIDRIKKFLGDEGAEGALMSGSGPSVFGIFKSEDQAMWARKKLINRDLGTVFAVEGFI